MSVKSNQFFEFLDTITSNIDFSSVVASFNTTIVANCVVVIGPTCVA